MEKIDIDRLGEVEEDRGTHYATIRYDGMKAVREIAEKVNEIIDHLNQ